MSTSATIALRSSAPTRADRVPTTGSFAALATLIRRRLSLSARTPREIMVPLLTPVR